MGIKHSYLEFEKHEAWKVIEKGITDLQSNGDIEELTARPYIVGYLAKLLAEADLLAAPAAQKVSGQAKSD